MAYNLAVRDYGCLTQDAERLADVLDMVSNTLEAIGYFVNLGTAGDMAGYVLDAMINLNNTEINAISATLSQGYTGLMSLKNQMDNNPTWQAIDVTYGVMLFVEEGFKVVASSNPQINRVKINGSWVS